MDYSDIRSYDEISTAEEFKDAYLTGDFNFSFAYFNYESENYNFAASLHSDNIFRTPEYALKYFLHLTDDVKTEVSNYPNNAKRAESENELYIACTFKDGESVKIPMHQINGIWYIDTSKVQQNMADYH